MAAKPSFSCFLISALILGASAAADPMRDDKPVKMDEMVVEEPKTHTLFMGADISINLDRDLYPVRDVFGNNWIVDVNGQQRSISARQAPLNLKVTPSLKLTEVAATISGFRRAPAYTFDNDPSVRITRGLTHAASLNSDLLAVSENALVRVDTMSNKAMGAAALFAGADDQFSANAMLTTAQYLYSDLHSNKVGPGGAPLTAGTAPLATGDPLDLGGLPGNANGLNVRIAAIGAAAAANQTHNGDEPAGRVATMGLDAMDVEFEISSPKPINNPYVVTITRFHPSGSKPGLVQNLVYAKSIDPIDSRVSHVHFVEDGFPFNYELVGFQLHLYDHGVEIATNIAADRVELTRKEAFDYIKLEYFSTHRGVTLPAVPVMGNLPADLPARLAAGKYRDTYYVKVSHEGLPAEAFLDPACTRKIEDPYLQSVVSRLRFKPALSEGRPVDAVAPLNLNKLTI
jgi:hypothetical protein